MSRIDTGRYKPSAENPNKLEYAGQKTAREVFNELQYKLKAEGYLPDEYFLLNSRLDESGAPFPDDADIMCNVNRGSNEGIYLDIMLRSRDEKGELQYKSFATRKSAALSACMQTNDIPSAMFMLVCGADFNKFMDTISDKFESGKLSEQESDFVFSVKSFWENNILKKAATADASAEQESEFDIEQE